MLERLKTEITKKTLRENQVGFWGHRDQIYVLKTILEEANEMGRNVLVLFIDLQKALDSVSRENPREILLLYEIVELYVRLIKSLYEYSSSTRMQTNHRNKY